MENQRSNEESPSQSNATLDKKKKVIYFLPEFPVNTETFISNELSQLISFGNLDITVFALAKGSGNVPDNVKDQVVYKSLSISACVKAVFSYVLNPKVKLKPILELMKGEDRYPYFFPNKNQKSRTTENSSIGGFSQSRFFQFLKGLAYAKMFEEYEPDHIHINFLSDFSNIGMVAAKVLEIDFSVSAHAADVFVSGSLIPIKAREAKFITICNGNTWQEVVRQANLTKSSGNVRLLFHGVDRSKLVIPEPPEKPSVPLVYTIGRLVEKKGTKYLIEASSILKKRGIAHVVKIGGGGPMYKEMQDYIAELGLQETVEILGDENSSPHDKTMAYLSIADVYAAPFIQTDSGDVDGVPYSVLEVAFARVPIVATDAGSMSDLIDENNGLSVPQMNSTALADAIEKLIFEEDLRNSLVEAAFKKANELFDNEKNTREIEKLLLS